MWGSGHNYTEQNTTEHAIIAKINGNKLTRGAKRFAVAEEAVPELPADAPPLPEEVASDKGLFLLDPIAANAVKLAASLRSLVASSCWIYVVQRGKNPN